MQERAILHVDMNAFYASVAQHTNLRLRNRPIVVAGDPKKRSGVVLAKSAEAKKCGVSTGETLWQARQKCPGLIAVEADYKAYKRYSRLAREIYYSYTDQVEPFGLDEAWLDVTGSQALFGDAYAIACDISGRIKRELGLTVSIGVSWNKVFAKLGSDIDPADGIVTITKDNYQKIAWPLPASKLLCVGRATAAKFRRSGILTIGDVAHINDVYCRHRFGGSGKVGRQLRTFARGEDTTPVKAFVPEIGDVTYAIKGVGNGLTAPHDLTCEEDVRALVWLLSESVAQRLREMQMRCRTVQVGARFAIDLSGYTRQMTLASPTCLTSVIAQAACSLLLNAYPLDPQHALRSIHVRTCGLSLRDAPAQQSIFDDDEIFSAENLEHTIDDLRCRFGNKCIVRGRELTDSALSQVDIKAANTVHPVGFMR